MSCLSEKERAEKMPRTKLRDTQIFRSQEKKEGVLEKEMGMEQPKEGKKPKKECGAAKRNRKKKWLRKDKGPTASKTTNSSSYKRTETRSLDFTRRMLFMHL